MTSEGPSLDRLVKLRTVADLDDLYDLLELNAIHESWCDAAHLNAERK